MYEVYKWTQRKSKDRRMMLLKKLLEEVPTVYRGGGKGSAPAAAPIIEPTAPVEEASVEIDDAADKTKVKSTKQSLKVPMAAPTTGLKV